MLKPMFAYQGGKTKIADKIVSEILKNHGNNITFCQGHKSKLGILAMNLLLGWTGIFWILALIWSLCNPNSNSVTVINNNNLNGGWK